eukprot:CAMPEP_0194564832 /NCGR_PEP_ID=MMETSP0292-20121207/4327_1 /TAXON_ID=39354 /ORGANISM="Heterosigma akashiwo, Strain CCMP2393" /LENGTH=300 /DNA_ID=CAMNT_0039414035 /DNA_START=477 /DNA_END=1376 /DNA_ORIENTATION=+
MPGNPRNPNPGLTAARILEKHHSKLEVVVVEPKPFFEYTPGILRAFVQPDLVSRLMVPMTEALGKHSTLIQGVSTSVEMGSCVSGSYCGKIRGQYSESGQDFELAFDYLMVCAGSAYGDAIKSDPLAPPSSIQQREMQVRAAAARAAAARGGGGLVGVELAAELAHGYPSKPITLVTKSPTILPGFPPRAQKKVHEWLVKRKVTIITSDAIVASSTSTQPGKKDKSEDQEVDIITMKTSKGTEIKADISFDCTGGKFGWGILENSFKTNNDGSRTFKGIPVDLAQWSLEPAHLGRVLAAG